MKLVTFNPYRALGIPGVRYLKPELALRHREELEGADWLLFPESWQANFLAWGLKARIFPSLSTYHLGYDKIEMTRAFWAVAPEHVPQTVILPPDAEAIRQIAEEFAFPVVAKEVRSSMGRGVHLLDGRRQLEAFAARQPVLYVQEYLPIRRDLRVVVVGGQVVCAYWREGAEGSFLNNVAQGGCLSFDDIPAAALDLALRVASRLGVDHAGFDLAEVDGHWYLFEFNPFFGNEGLRRRHIHLGPIIYDYLLSQTVLPPEKPILPPLARTA